LGKLTALPEPQADLRAPFLRERGRGKRGREREGKGENESDRRLSKFLEPPLERVS